MLDQVFEGATVVDGTGAAPYTADVAVQDGRIVRIDASGRINDAAHERIKADGAWLTPGFVDIHTHYDGQATWDETFSPSIHHGVTTVLMGNCGVGFAPHVPGRAAELIALMEGVEDIPGAALAEGVKFNWTSFAQYMDVLDAMPHSIDFLAQVPHDPLRMAVMGDRALAQQAATAEDIAAMQRLLRQALERGLEYDTEAQPNPHAPGCACHACAFVRKSVLSLGVPEKGDQGAAQEACPPRCACTDCQWVRWRSRHYAKSSERAALAAGVTRPPKARRRKGADDSAAVDS
jgi:hypothetical protein